MIRALALSTLAFMVSAGLAFGQPAEVGPSWSSDQVRAARGVASEEALAFDVRQDTEAAGAAPKVETSHVVLAADFTYVISGKTRTLDDFKLHRTFFWSGGAATFANLNSHALPAFRVLELASRRTLEVLNRRLESTTGKSLGSYNDEPYWSDAELGVADPSDLPLTLQKTASGTDLLLGGDSVVRTDGQAFHLLEADLKPLTRYLALHLPLHPQARHAIVDTGALPARMTIELYALGRKETASFTFTAPTRSPAAYPLPAGLAADVEAMLGAQGSASEPGVRAAVQAIGGRFEKPKPTPRDITSAMQKAAAAGRPMEVWLWFSMFVQQYGYELRGANSPALTKVLVPLAKGALQNPDVARFQAASNLAGDAPNAPGDRQNAARYLAAATALDSLPFGTFRYVTFANLVSGSKDVTTWDKAIFKAMPSPLVANYWTHIAAYPWAGNAYDDAGGSYLRSFDTPKAWTAFDLGRAVDPDWRSGSLQSVANYEAVLEANVPDFF